MKIINSKSFITFLYILIYSNCLIFETFASDTLFVNNTKIIPGQSVHLEFESSISDDTLLIYAFECQNLNNIEVSVKTVLKKNGIFALDYVTNLDSRLLYFQIRNLTHEIIYQNNDFIEFTGTSKIENESKCQLAKYLSKNYSNELNIPAEINKSINLFEKSFILFPELEDQFTIPYLINLNENSIENSTKILQILEKNKNSNQPELLWQLANSFRNLNRLEDFNNLYQKIKTEFPCDIFITNHIFTYQIPEFNKLSSPKEKIEFWDRYRTKLGQKFYCEGNQFNFRWVYSELFKSYFELNQLKDWYTKTDTLELFSRTLTYSSTLSKLLHSPIEIQQMGKELGKKFIELSTQFLNMKRRWTETNSKSDFEIIMERKKLLANGIVSLAIIYENLGLNDSAYIYYEMGVHKFANFQLEDINEKYLNFCKKISHTSLLEFEKISLKNQKKDPLLLSFEKSFSKMENIKINKSIRLINKPFIHLNINSYNNELYNLDLGKIYILNFWSTWCVSCIAKFSTIDFLLKKYKDDEQVEVLMINTLENKGDGKVKSLIKMQGFDFETLFDRNNELEEIYQIKSLPFLLIVDQNSNIRYQETGYKPNDTASNIISVIEKLKKQN